MRIARFCWQAIGVISPLFFALFPSCGPPARTAPILQPHCDDTQNDVRNCGFCGHDCTALPHVNASKARCLAGACDIADACIPGFAHCNDDRHSGCESSLASEANCGACGTSCTRSRPLCFSDRTAAWRPLCVSECPLDKTRCGATCVDTQSNVAHCGACDRPCTPVDLSGAPVAVCALGRCETSCRAGTIRCAGTCYSADNAPLPSDDPCVIDDTLAVFVSLSLGTRSGDGARTRAVNSIQRGIELAAASRKRLYVCAERDAHGEPIAYDESLVVRYPIAIFGGLDCADGTWKASAQSAIISPRIGIPMVIQAGSVSLASLVLSAPHGSLRPSDSTHMLGAHENSIALFAINASNLALTGMTLIASNAARGLDRITSTIAFASRTPFPPHASGHGRRRGANGSWLPIVRAGERGLDGTNGANGIAGAELGLLTEKGWFASSGDNGGKGATGESGWDGLPERGRIKRGGAGGDGGEGGAGGGGGGASVALLMFNSTAAIEQSAIRAGDAGDGGDGDVGERGADGEPGEGADDPQSIANFGLPGGAGGDGGNGGLGGTGAGGTGGISACIARLSGAVQFDTSTKMHTGKAGRGGSAPNGRTGAAAIVLDLEDIR